MNIEQLLKFSYPQWPQLQVLNILHLHIITRLASNRFQIVKSEVRKH